MMYETGEVESLKELLDKFLVFAQKYNETTVSWQLIDDRSDSFFGSTLKIPLDSYHYTGYKGKNVWIVNSSDFFDNVVYDGDKSIHMWSIGGVFQHIFEGAQVNVITIKDDNNIENTHPTAMSLLNFLKKTKNSPNVIFFGGVSDTMFVEKTLNSYDTLSDYCNENNIELRLFYFPYNDNNIYEENLEQSKQQFFRFRPEYSHDKISNSVEVQEEFETKNDSIFFSNFTNFWKEYKVPKKFSGTSLNGYDDVNKRPPIKESFSRFMKKIDIIMNIMLKVYRPYYYASFQYRRITGSSYSDFFYTKHDVMSEEINKVTGVGGRSFTGKGGIQAFNDTGEMIATGLHLSYDPDLWLCEQGNVTCEAEASDKDNHMNLLPFWEYRHGSPYKRMDIPEYPATGCPWLTISDRNKTEYSVGKNNKIKYYFSKSNRNATIVFRVIDGNGIYKDCWQTLVFGCFKYDTYSTIPPLYVAGGNQALVPDVWVYKPTSNRVNGLRYLLDMKNPCLSNSNLAYPTDFGNAHMSNFRVLGYDGKWRNIFSLCQTYTEHQYFDVCSPVFSWGVPINQYTQIDSNQSYLHLSKSGMYEMYRKDKFKYDLNDRHFLLHNIEVSTKPNTGKDENNIHGMLNNCYITPDFDKESGEIETETSKYIVVPNGWDERLWYYPWYLGRIYWGGKNELGEDNTVYKTQVANEKAYRNYHTLENHYIGNKNKINTKLVLKTGEVENVRDFDLDVDNNITKDNENTEQRRKLMELYIKIQEDPYNIINIKPKRTKISGFGYYWSTTNSIKYSSPIIPGSHSYVFPNVWLDDMPKIMRENIHSSNNKDDVNSEHGPIVLQFYEGYLPSDGDLYSFGKDESQILKTWHDMIDIHNKTNSNNDFIIVMFGRSRLSNYASYTQKQYEDSFKVKRQYTDLDKQIFKMLKEVNPVIIDCSGDFYTKICPLVEDFNKFTDGKSFTPEFSEKFSDAIDKEIDIESIGRLTAVIAELQFYAEGRTLLVDWGDGTDLQYYTGWESIEEYRHYSDGINKKKYRTRMRHRYNRIGNYIITIYGENNSSYEHTFKFHTDLGKHPGLIQFFSEVPIDKQMFVYDDRGNMTSEKLVVNSAMKNFYGFSIDGASYPRNGKKDFTINPDFYYALKHPDFNLNFFYDPEGLTSKDSNGKIIEDLPPFMRYGYPFYTNSYSEEKKSINSYWLGSLVNCQINGRFEDIFEQPNKTWWMIMQRTGTTSELKEKFYDDFFGISLRTKNHVVSNISDLTDCYFYGKNIVENKDSWIHIYESTFKNIYFKGNRDSVYLDIYKIEYSDVQIHLCKTTKLLYVDNFPAPIEGNNIRFNIYSDTVFHVVDMSGNMRYYPFYCKKEQIDKFSKANPELTFRELIV